VALAESTDSLPQRRIEAAAANTWDQRCASIDTAVRQSCPCVSIIIVSYNSAEFLRPCLDSVLKNTTYPRYEVIVVDNASQDDGPAVIDQYVAIHSHVHSYAMPQNLGFAGANNFGVQKATGDYLVFLNADTLVTVGWVEFLLRHLRRDSTIGLLTAVTNFAGNEIKINVDYANQAEMELFAARIAWEQFGKVFDVAVAPLYCALLPRSVWEAVGTLDEDFGIGMFEDDDFSMRVREAGLRVAAAEDCFIHHFGQGSFSKLTEEKYRRIFEDNQRIYEKKWKVTWQAHRTREGVRPAHEEARFNPRIFCELTH
jgi:GT2 family glycosyltransferase